MLLQIVALAGDVGDDFLAVGQADLRDLAQGGIRLLGRAGHDLHADAAALRRAFERGRLRLDDDFAASFADQLVDRGHSVFLLG